MKTGQDNSGLADNEITGLNANLNKLKKVCAHMCIHTVYIWFMLIENLLKTLFVCVTK